MSSHPQPARVVANEANLREQLDTLVQGLVGRRGVRHALVAIETGDRAFRWLKAVGEADADGRPLQVDTPMFIASVTKLYIAAVVLQLHEHGSLRLDEAMTAYLPPELVQGLHRLDGVDHTGQISVRHLLGHTSGIPDWLEDRPRGGQAWLDTLPVGSDRVLDIAAITQHVREQLVPHFPPQPPEAERQRVRYSDTNYQLLMAIIEAVTGKPLPQVFTEQLYRPLGLRHTWHPGAEPLEPAPAPAAFWLGAAPFEQPLLLQSFRDLYCSADDGLRFMRALVRGEVFQRPETAQLMRARWNRFGLPRDAASMRLPNWPIEYGLGMMRYHLPRVFTPFKPLPAVIGHTGVTGSWSFYCPQRDLYLWGSVSQGAAAPLPFRFVPRLLRTLEAGGL